MWSEKNNAVLYKFQKPLTPVHYLSHKVKFHYIEIDERPRENFEISVDSRYCGENTK
jgi:hypothetical protein